MSFFAMNHAGVIPSGFAPRVLEKWRQTHARSLRVLWVKLQPANVVNHMISPFYFSPPIGGGANKNASLRRSWSVIRLALARGYRAGVQNYRRFSGYRSGIGIWSLISGLPLLAPFRVRGALSPSIIYNVKKAI